MEESKNQKYISLFEAAKLCSYSEPYLRLRSRQGKLKSIKLGKKWMTTSAWLDDYQSRVEQWRKLAAAKKNALATPAMFAPAPPEVAKVILPPEVDPDFSATPKRILPPSPKRKLAGFSVGQIFPPPRPAAVGNHLNYIRPGALFSGAMVALLFFVAVRPQIILNIRDFGESSGQANVSHAVLSSVQNHPQEAKDGVPAPVEALNVISNGALKELVRAIAAWFDSI